MGKETEMDLPSKSWKTTLFGAGGIATVIFTAVMLLVDGDPKTNPDWALVVAALMPAIGLLFARDNNKTSADVGAEDKK